MAFEQGMGFHGYRYREGPQPATPFSRAPVADYFQTTSHIYSCWDLDGNPSGFLDLPCAAAICTGVGSEKTLTSASRACRAQRKKSSKISPKLVKMSSKPVNPEKPVFRRPSWP